MIPLAAGLQISVHELEALSYAFQKFCVEQHVDFLHRQDVSFVQFVGLFVVAPGFKFDNVLTIPLKKTYFVLPVGNILNVAH